MNLKNVKAGQTLYTNDGRPVVVRKCIWDAYGSWAHGEDNYVYRDRDVHLTSPVATIATEIARLSAVSPEFAEGYRLEQIALGRTGKQD